MKHKMLFNTGVRSHNRLNLSGPQKGQFVLNENEELKDNQIHLVFYVEQEPPKNSKFNYLSPTPECRKEQIAIPVVDGYKSLADGYYAVFTVFEEKK